MNFPKKNADHEIKAFCKESSNLLVALEGQDEYKKSKGRLFCENDSNKPRAFFTLKFTYVVCCNTPQPTSFKYQCLVVGMTLKVF